MPLAKHFESQFSRFSFLASWVLSASLLSGCSSIARATYLELLPLSGFETHAANPIIFFEPDAKTAADVLAASYDKSVATVEANLGSALRRRPWVYLCATDACYDKYAFNKAGQAEARGRGNLVLMKAAPLQHENRLLPVFTHELIHAFWFQQGIRCTPRWWTEGLAVESSGGGGAEKVMKALAVQAMHSGQVFQASDENSCLTRMPPGLKTMAWPMFYRQSGMFVEWLRGTDSPAFHRLLEKLQTGENLASAMKSSYGQSMAALHKNWQSSVVPAVAELTLPIQLKD